MLWLVWQDDITEITSLPRQDLRYDIACVEGEKSRSQDTSLAGVEKSFLDRKG